MLELNLWLQAQTEDRRRVNRERRFDMGSISKMTSVEFVRQFRLDKETFILLCDDLKRFTSLRGTRRYPVEVKVISHIYYVFDAVVQ
jgi:hypothetical protein